MLAISAFFQDSNYIEAVLWCAIGLAFLIRVMANPAKRGDALIAVITFLFFGASDYVEAHTGGWWRPWWLLVWKGLCLLIFLILWIRYARDKHRPPENTTQF